MDENEASDSLALTPIYENMSSDKKSHNFRAEFARITEDRTFAPVNEISLRLPSISPERKINTDGDSQRRLR